MLPPCGSRRASASADGRDRLRCPGRRRPAAGAAHPPGSTGARAGRASPRRAIADRRGRARADVPGRANTPRKRRNTSWKRLLRVLRRKIRDRRLLSDDELQLGNEVDMSWPFGPSASPRASRQPAKLGVALAQKCADQALKRLRQRRIRDVALVLIELAGGEKAARRHQRLVQLVDDRGLADAGIAGDQHQLRPRRWRRRGRRRRAGSRSRARARTASPGSAAGRTRPVAPSGKASMRRCASHSARQRRRSRSQAGGGLVAVLGGLGEQLHDDRRERRPGQPATRSLGGAGCRAMWQCTHSIGSAAVNGSDPVSIS